MKEKRCGIYVLDHIETGRLYVGQSTGPRQWQLSDESRAKMSVSAKARRAREKQEREASP